MRVPAHVQSINIEGLTYYPAREIYRDIPGVRGPGEIIMREADEIPDEVLARHPDLTLPGHILNQFAEAPAPMVQPKKTLPVFTPTGDTPA